MVGVCDVRTGRAWGRVRGGARRKRMEHLEAMLLAYVDREYTVKVCVREIYRVLLRSVLVSFEKYADEPGLRSVLR